MGDVWRALGMWSPWRWRVAALIGAGTALLVAVPTAVIPNPVFGRAVAVTWWSYPTVALTGLLGGLLLATYVREPGQERGDRALRLGTIGGLLSFFAVGCPVCNKLVLLAVGTAGAMAWFAPLQPLLALASLIVLGWSLTLRLRRQVACRTS
ncbi:MAG: hypothetical protein KGP10_05210 [Actinomycetales bacterium]|nr:hypothetical protein [Actinomycetales bacterium]